jgi:hypothetical protein
MEKRCAINFHKADSQYSSPLSYISVRNFHFSYVFRNFLYAFFVVATRI